MKKWNLIVDVADCTNCNNCTLAVQDEYVGNSFPGYAAEMPRHGHHWIDIRRKERGQAPMIDVAYLPVMCQHCDDAPCMKAATNDAIKKRGDGIVIIDPDKAKGQKAIVDACPYGAVWWNEESQTPQAWFFDAHLLDQGWKEPRGCQVCATRAMRAVCVEDAEMATVVAAEGLETLNPEFETNPRVYYKNLYRYMKCFIGGSIAAETDGVVDCVEGAAVVLKQGSATIAETATDNYGDFKFDRLDENSGAYSVEISADGRAPRIVEVALATSRNIGVVMV